MKIEERFLKYMGYPTMSDEESESTPSTQKQLALGRALVEELAELGLTDACMDGRGYVYATLPATTEGYSSVGLIAHLDTAHEMPDSPIKARIVEYTGGDIVLNNELGIVMKEADFPALRERVGEHLIVTDGTTLLGADDKAGIAEIMCAIERLISEGTPHGKVCVAFTPDEEIGRGADFFDVKKFGADYAYTVDGCALGELEYENFNAASAKISIKGFAIHPGNAKGKMKNAARIAAELDGLLPTDEIPEKTDGYEGFHHLLSITGETERAELHYIIRDHDRDKFEDKKDEFVKVCDSLNEKYGEGTVALTLTDSYYNMKEVIENHLYTVERAERAMRSVGITPIKQPIRGGTDGSRLSFMGLPCPNLGTGSANCHSGFEYASIECMNKVTDLLCEIIKTAKN